MNLLSLAPVIIAPLVSSNSITTLLLIPLMILAFYFLLIRPQRKRQQQQQKLLSELGPGSRVLTHTGIFGTVVAMGDKQAELEIAPGIRVTVLRQTIARAARPEDEDSAPTGDEFAAAGPAADETGSADTIPTAGVHESDTVTTPGVDPDTVQPETMPAADNGAADAESGGIRDVTSTYFSRGGEDASEHEPTDHDEPAGQGASGESALTSSLFDDDADRGRSDDDRDQQATKDA